MAELQIGKVALQRIFFFDRTSAREQRDLEEFNRKLLNELEERWGPNREEDADISKRPLIRYEDWRVIEAGYNEEGRKRSHLEEQMCDENMARWTNWQKKPSEEQRNWLKELGIYHRRRPVLESAEDLWGGKKREKKGY